MSKNDNTERVLRDIHMMISKCPRYGEREIIVNRREILTLLDRLNHSIYDMMETYEQTERSRATAEREVKRRGDGIIETASARAEDVYAAAMVFTADMLGRVQDMLDEAHESIGDMMSQFSEEINKQKHTVRSNQTEIESHLSEMHDTQKYLNLITDANKEIEREKARRERLKNVGRKVEHTAIDDDIQVHEDSEYYRQWQEQIAPELEDQLDELDQIDLRVEMDQRAQAQAQKAIEEEDYLDDIVEAEEEFPDERKVKEIAIPADAEVDALLAEINLKLEDEPEIQEEIPAMEENLEEAAVEEVAVEAASEEATVEEITIETASEEETAEEVVVEEAAVEEEPVEEETAEEEAAEEATVEEVDLEAAIVEETAAELAEEKPASKVTGDTVVLNLKDLVSDVPDAPADFDGGSTINLSEAIRRELQMSDEEGNPFEVEAKAEHISEAESEAAPEVQEEVVSEVEEEEAVPETEEAESVSEIEAESVLVEEEEVVSAATKEPTLEELIREAEKEGELDFLDFDDLDDLDDLEEDEDPLTREIGQIVEEEKYTADDLDLDLKFEDDSEE